MLKTGTMGFLGLGLGGGLGVGIGGCASGSGRGGSLVLAPVRVSWDRVIRTTVGLRPHRPSGFVLRAERLDAKPSSTTTATGAPECRSPGERGFWPLK